MLPAVMKAGLETGEKWEQVILPHQKSRCQRERLPLKTTTLEEGAKVHLRIATFVLTLTTRKCLSSLFQLFPWELLR